MKSNHEGREVEQQRLAKSLAQLGWCGLWLQLLVGAVPVGLMIYFFVFARSASGPRSGLAFVEYLTMANLLVLAFTTFWSYRYTLLAKRVARPESRPAAARVVRAVWTGIGASALGILFSMVIMFIEAAHLLFYFLSAPQAGVPVIQKSGTDAASWVSAADMVSLMALIVTLFAELITLAFGLWLLFRALRAANELPSAAA